MFLQEQQNCQLSIIQNSFEGILDDDGSDTGFVFKIVQNTVSYFFFCCRQKSMKSLEIKRVFFKSCKRLSNLGGKNIQPKVDVVKKMLYLRVKK